MEVHAQAAVLPATSARTSRRRRRHSLASFTEHQHDRSRIHNTPKRIHNTPKRKSYSYSLFSQLLPHCFLVGVKYPVPGKRHRGTRYRFVRVCVVGFGWMVVRFVRVIRVPARAPVCPVCPVCVPAPPGVFLPVRCPVCPVCVPAPPGVFLPVRGGLPSPMPSGSRPRCSHVRAPSPSPSPPPRLRVSVVVWGGACVPGFGCGLALESVHGEWGWF